MDTGVRGGGFDGVVLGAAPANKLLTSLPNSCDTLIPMDVDLQGVNVIALEVRLGFNVVGTNGLSSVAVSSISISVDLVRCCCCWVAEKVGFPILADAASGF